MNEESSVAEDIAAVDGPHVEQGPPMTELERIRHSCAHVLATAILRLWPEAQFAAGPPVENGFYYDVELPHRISPDDFEKIEAEMKKEVKANHRFERVELSRADALAMASRGELGALGARPDPSKFKLDIIENIPESETITIYRNGDFTDLCAGPHVMRTGNIGAFRLTNVASAYYKGDEKNPQLQRIYGTAFKNKTQLDEYFAMLEEAKKRDHRKLGKELELFTFDDDVGPGLPLWLPRGAAIIEELEKLAKETEFAAGYQRVRTTNLARAKLYEKSGHLPYYAESMFPPVQLKLDPEQEKELILLRKQQIETWRADAEEAMEADIEEGRTHSQMCTKRTARRSPAEQTDQENARDVRRFSLRDRYYLKAMNCPHHHKLYAALPRSYRDSTSSLGRVWLLPSL